MKRKERLSMRVPSNLVDALDAAAAAQHRLRSNYVDWVFAQVLAVAPAALVQLQAPIDDKRMRLLSFRLSRDVVVKLDRAATREKRTRTEVAAALLAGSVAPGWRERLDALLPARAATPNAAASNVFA